MNGAGNRAALASIMVRKEGRLGSRVTDRDFAMIFRRFRTARRQLTGLYPLSLIAAKDGSISAHFELIRLRRGNGARNSVSLAEISVRIHGAAGELIDGPLFRQDLAEITGVPSPTNGALSPAPNRG